MKVTGTVLVTGAAHGIGAATAAAVAEDGAAVALLDRDGDAAAEQAARLARSGARTVALTCDVTDHRQVCAAVSETTRALGTITGLVTAAGVERGGPTHTLPLEDWRATLETNLTGTFTVCRAVLRAREENGGGPLSIVLVSSPAAFVGLGGQNAAYAASKGGVSGLVGSLMKEYAPAVRVNAVLPGATETALMWGEMNPAEVASAREKIAEQTPMARLADPADIAHPVRFLLSGGAAFVTGAQVPVDGGLLATGAISL